MAGKKETDQSASRPTLMISRQEAKERIEAQIAKGRSLADLTIGSQSELDQARNDYQKWGRFTFELLQLSFNRETYAREFDHAGSSFSWGGAGQKKPFTEKVSNLQEEVRDKVSALESILERLVLIPESNAIQGKLSQPQQRPVTSRKVFVVHGHDRAAKESVARCLERLGLEPIILHEQPNIGRTLINKFEDHADVGFAVVLLTPDDVCASSGDPDKEEKRARQNVIFELGYFLGRLGSKKVCPLYKAPVKIPSDYAGVVYLPLDDAGAWKLELGKELKAAGIEVDLNKL